MGCDSMPTIMKGYIGSDGYWYEQPMFVMRRDEVEEAQLYCNIRSLLYPDNKYWLDFEPLLEFKQEKTRVNYPEFLAFEFKFLINPNKEFTVIDTKLVCWKEAINVPIDNIRFIMDKNEYQYIDYRTDTVYRKGMLSKSYESFTNPFDKNTLLSEAIETIENRLEEKYGSHYKKAREFDFFIA